MKLFVLGVAVATMLPTAGLADAQHSHEALAQHGAIVSQETSDTHPSFDILAAHVHRDANLVTFHMTLADGPGDKTPEPVGEFGGATVYSYVWPTSLKPEVVGFEGASGILALVATSHPDFDDTPLFDENGDGDLANDGALWHSHWVVLAPNDACGEGMLSVVDIPEGTAPKMPATWPGLPIYIDSPGYSPVIKGRDLAINVAFADEETVAGMAFDGVTSALRVNQSVHAPLLCVTDVFDVASGDLSLPGRIAE